MDKSLSKFKTGIRSAVRGIFQGHLDALNGADALYSTIQRGFNNAWTEGAMECGIKPDERTEEEQKRLDLMIGDNFQYVGRFVSWIIELQAKGGTLDSAFVRANEWIARYNQVQVTAREMACSNAKEIWIMDGGEHCCDCLRLHNRVYRNSTWHKYDIQPQSAKLACFGGHCKCRREKTDLPITKGRPPVLRGPGGCGKVNKKK